MKHWGLKQLMSSSWPLLLIIFPTNLAIWVQRDNQVSWFQQGVIKYLQPISVILLSSMVITKVLNSSLSNKGQLALTSSLHYLSPILLLSASQMKYQGSIVWDSTNLPLQLMPTLELLFYSLLGKYIYTHGNLKISIWGTLRLE